jgi:2-phospho-L-lactate guanylyltransferase (CobY/MobA/RfbA family)
MNSPKIPGTNQHTPKRAVLFFTRTPRTEAKAKPIAGLSFVETQILYGGLIRSVLKEASATGYPVVVATDDPSSRFFSGADSSIQLIEQRGDSFNARLTAATQDAFASGYDEIVVIGNDCVNLSAKSLHHAFEQLGKSDVVLGSANDGGVYLIGAKKESLASVLSIFVECRWETGHVQQDILARAAQCHLSCSLLEAYTDIDSSADLINVAAWYPSIGTLRRFADILLVKRKQFFQRSSLLFLRSEQTLRLRYQKAPPVA